VEPRLRRPGKPRRDEPALAPARDLFDGGRRLRGIEEFAGVPWRPWD
jgi:hypothetical protein